MTNTLAYLLASACDARKRCMETPDTHGDWIDRHTESIRYFERNLLPSGSGIDSGTTVDLDKSGLDRLVFHTSFHHMNEYGDYDGWTEHTITVRPTFIGPDVSVSGRNRNDIKEYLAQLFSSVLEWRVTHTYDQTTQTSTYTIAGDQ